MPAAGVSSLAQYSNAEIRRPRFKAENDKLLSERSSEFQYYENINNSLLMNTSGRGPNINPAIIESLKELIQQSRFRTIQDSPDLFKLCLPNEKVGNAVKMNLKH